jgi:hypothetical protein
MIVALHGIARGGVLVAASRGARWYGSRVVVDGSGEGFGLWDVGAIGQTLTQHFVAVSIAE